MSIHKSVLSAVSWLSLGNLMARALSLITMPVLTRYLSPQAYGEAALVSTVVSLSSVIALAGIDMGYSRHVYSGHLGDSDAVQAFCWRWALSASAAMACIVGMIWLIAAYAFGLPRSLAGFAVLGVFASGLTTMAQSRARLENRYSQLSWVQFASACTGAAVSLAIAIFWRQDAWALLMAMVVGYAMPALLLGVPSWRALGSASKLKPDQRWQLLATGLAGVVTAPAYWVLSSSDRWFLAAYHGSEQVGIYSIGYTVGTVGIVVSTAITGAWLPELARAESADGESFTTHKSDMTQTLAALLMIVSVAIASAGGDIIRALADARFYSAGEIVPWLAASVLFYGWLHVGNALLVLAGKLHWAALAWCAALIVSLYLNWKLVPVHGALGAALTQAASFLLVMVLVWLAALHFERLRLDWRRLAASFALSVIVAIIMIPAWAPTAWGSLLLKFPAGLLYATACLWLLAPNMLRSVVHRFRPFRGAV